MRLQPLSPVSHSWGTSRGTHSQMRGLHCAHTQWALHQNWCHSRPHSWLQTTVEDALKVKSKIPHVRVTKVNITSHQCFHQSYPSKWGTPEIDASGPTSLLSELPAISIQLLHTNTFTRPSHQLTIPITCIQAFLERERKKPKNSWIQLEIEMRTFWQQQKSGSKFSYSRTRMRIQLMISNFNCPKKVTFLLPKMKLQNNMTWHVYSCTC